MNRTVATHASTIALVSGLAFLTDITIITILDRNFGLLDDALFFLGLICGLVSLGLLPAVWSRGRLHRVPLALGGFLLLAAGTVASMGFGEWLIPTLYAGDNAISTEGAFLCAGVFWVLVGLVARTLVPARRTVSA